MLKNDFKDLNDFMEKTIREYHKLNRRIYTAIDPIVARYGMKDRFKIQIDWQRPIILMDIKSSQQKPIPNEFINEVSEELQATSKNIEIIDDKLRLTFEYD